jgi:hypothetical protein
MSPSLPMRVIARSIGTESEEKSLTIIEHAESFEWSNAALAGRLGIPPLADDGRSHPCGGRVYGFCISSKQERAGQRVEPGTGIHPNRTAKGYAGICIGWRAAEGEGEIARRATPATLSGVDGLLMLEGRGLKRMHQLGAVC